MGEKNKLENKILGILKKLQKMTALEMMRFDVRDYEFRRVVADALAELEADFEEYKNPSNNIVVKTAIGKKWAQGGTLNFDYDASLFATCVYLLAMFPNKAPSSIKLISENVYCFTFAGENYYRGDTMNSWLTTLNAFFNKRGYQYLLVPGFFEAHLLPEYITNFMTIVYTIGNFFPLPKTLNIPRGSRTRSKDYWDLALLAIYQHYKKTEDEAYEPKFTECTLEWVFDTKNEETCIKWLCSFNGWNHFVEQNFLQDFVHEDKESGGCGRPKELWTGHFENQGNMPSGAQFSEFFTNASAWILARGARIAPEVKKQLENKDLYGLARQMAG
ncbi:MAG: hypothetical protein K2P08_09300 [Oscillospiraceae bacterium]|nr:hypothetical protein [Oscillospiraceae bacterium]